MSVFKANCFTKIIGLLFVFISLSSPAEQRQTSSFLNDKAYTFFRAGNYTESYQLSLDAQQQAIAEKNNKELARALSNIASNLSFLGNNEKASQLYSQSLALAEDENDTEGILRALNNIASIYRQVGNDNEVLLYRQKQYQVAMKLSDTKEQIHALIGLSQANLRIGEIEQSKDYLQTAKVLLEQTPDDFTEIYWNFAASSIYEAQGNWAEALASLENALSLAKKNNFGGLIASTLVNIAVIKYEQQHYESAEKLATESLNLAIELQLNSKIVESRRLLAKIYETNKDYKNALAQIKLLEEIELKLTGEKVKIFSEITRIDRQMAETRKQLEQSDQRRKIAELRYKNQQRFQVIVAVVAAFILISGFFWFYRRASRLEIDRQKKVNQELLELDQLKDRILTNTSHELRTPLNGIIGLADVILMTSEDELSDSTKEQIQLIGNSGKQLSEIVDDILDLAQLRTRKMTFHFSSFDINLLIEEVIQLCQTTQNKSVKIEFFKTDKPLIINQDKKRTRQILFNLIGNATKFTQKGSISINCSLDEQFVLFSVQDSGIGIPENKLERIFEGFEQVDSKDSRQFGGSGLGLAICREIATALGGNILVESQINIGTTMTVYLPAMK